MPDPKKRPEPDKDKRNTVRENRTGREDDDNIDDLGRPVNAPEDEPLEQPSKTDGKRT